MTIHDIPFYCDLFGRGDVIENDLAISSRVGAHTAGCSELAGYCPTIAFVYERREDFSDQDILGCTSNYGGVI